MLWVSEKFTVLPIHSSAIETEKRVDRGDKGHKETKEHKEACRDQKNESIRDQKGAVSPGKACWYSSFSYSICCCWINASHVLLGGERSQHTLLAFLRCLFMASGLEYSFLQTRHANRGGPWVSKCFLSCERSIATWEHSGHLSLGFCGRGRLDLYIRFFWINQEEARPGCFSVGEKESRRTEDTVPLFRTWPFY